MKFIKCTVAKECRIHPNNARAIQATKSSKHTKLCAEVICSFTSKTNKKQNMSNGTIKTLHFFSACLEKI